MTKRRVSAKCRSSLRIGDWSIGPLTAKKETMSQPHAFLSSPQPRARWMRLDTAQLLKRFFFCERSLLVSQAAWIPTIAPLDIKIGLARFVWQSAETADALRNRLFEFRSPAACWRRRARIALWSNS